MTEEEFLRARDLDKKATEGPWIISSEGIVNQYGPGVEDRDLIAYPFVSWKSDDADICEPGLRFVIETALDEVRSSMASYFEEGLENE